MNEKEANRLRLLNPVFAERILERQAIGETGRSRIQQVALMINIFLCQMQNVPATKRHLSNITDLDIDTLHRRLNSLIQGGFITIRSFLRVVNAASNASVDQYFISDEYILHDKDLRQPYCAV